MKYCILVGDGMGDYPVDALAGKTPLEVAHTPMMDELCQRGELFLNKTVPGGFPPGSDVANMALLGYDPAKYYTGRAPLEAGAMNIDLQPDEIAFRCNMVTLEKENNGGLTMVDFSAGHITNEESHQLIQALQEECGDEMFHFYPGVSYRHLMVLRGEHPGCTTVPPHDHIQRDVTEHFNAYLANPKWKALLEKVAKVFANHPVNLERKAQEKHPATMVWLWGEGKKPSAPNLQQRFNITGSMVSAVDLLKGLGVIGGLSVINVPGATGYIDTNYQGKAAAAMQSLDHQDFVFVHLEGPDEAGHKGSLADKLTAIEDFDSKIVAPIYQHLMKKNEPFRMVVTMDHFTPLALRTHTSDAVPTLLYDSRKTDGCGRQFNEREALQHDEEANNGISQGHLMINKLLER